MDVLPYLGRSIFASVSPKIAAASTLYSVGAEKREKKVPLILGLFSTRERQSTRALRPAGIKFRLHANEVRILNQEAWGTRADFVISLFAPQLRYNGQRLYKL